MKIKPAYIYIPIAVVAIAFLVIVSQQNDTTTKSLTTTTSTDSGKMPEDEIHKGMQAPGSETPSKENVNSTFKHQIEMLDKDVKNHPNDTLKLREYADLLTAGHKGTEAIQHYNKILKIDPNRRDIYFALTFIYYNQQDFVKAEDLTKKILSLDPNDIQAIYNLGAIAIAKGDRQKGKTIWEKLIKDFPNSESANQAKTSLEKL
jgi:cytochrome c-type biogenesis protein CcmH/NrfG